MREACAQDRVGIARSLARAFQDDPVSEFLFPDTTLRAQRLPRFYSAVLRFFDHLGLVHTNDGLQGAAAWQMPNAAKPKLLDVLPATIRMAVALRSSWSRLSKLNAEVVPFHPREPHWYLAILGTDPSAQGKGVGSKLLSPILQRCDDQRIVAYLESSKEANISFYQRHGFRVSQEIQVPQGPMLWGMRREPQADEN